MQRQVDEERSEKCNGDSMSGFFGKPASKPKLPAVPPPAAIPQVAPETGDTAMKQAKLRSGFQNTILAGDMQPKAQKKSILG